MKLIYTQVTDNMTLWVTDCSLTLEPAAFRIFIESKTFTNFNSGLQLGLHQRNLHGFGKHCIYHMSQEISLEIIMLTDCRRKNTILKAWVAEENSPAIKYCTW